MSRPIPLLGDISLEHVQRIEHAVDAGFVATPIAGLEGHVQQRAGRPSQRLRMRGELFGESAADDLSTLQKAALAGEELTFAADIAGALDLSKVVITEFRALELAGQPDRFAYELEVVESPPLPPPATVDAFGGLDDFGLGDLGFDAGFADGLLDELGDLAGDVAGAIDGALDVLDALGSLASLDGLSLDGLLAPMNAPLEGLAGASQGLGGATSTLATELETE